MWAGMSSGPSIVCVQYGASSGTAALKYASKSSRTSGEAFSFSVSDGRGVADEHVQQPDAAVAAARACASSTSRVTRWKPRGRGRRRISRWTHMAAYGSRATRMSTRSPRNGTPSASSSARWRAPLASEPSARTTRCQGTSSGSAARTARCRRSAARPARGRRRCARSPPGSPGSGRRIVRSPILAAVMPPRHVFNRRARSRDRRARRGGAVALVLRRPAVRLGARRRRRGGHAVGGRARLRAERARPARRTARPRRAGAGRAAGRRPAGGGAPGRGDRRARRPSRVHTGADCIAARRPRGRRALQLPGEHDGPRDRARRRCPRRSRPPAGPLADRLLAALQAAEGEGGDVRGRQSAALAVVRRRGRAVAARPSTCASTTTPAPLDELRRLLTLQRAYELAGRGRRADGRRAAPRRPASSTARAAELAPESDELLFWAGLALANAGDLEARRGRGAAGGRAAAELAGPARPPLRRDFAPAGETVRSRRWAVQQTTCR